MKRTGRVARATARALPPTILVGAGILLFGAFDVMRRGTRPAVAAIIGLALTAVVFVTYFILGVARYRVNAGGAVRVPWPYAWLLVLVVILAVGTMAFLRFAVCLNHGAKRGA